MPPSRSAPWTRTAGTILISIAMTASLATPVLAGPGGSELFVDEFDDVRAVGAVPIPKAVGEGLDLLAGSMSLTDDGETLVVSLEVDDVPAPQGRTLIHAVRAGWAFVFMDPEGNEISLRAQPYTWPPSTTRLVAALCSNGVGVDTRLSLEAYLDEPADRVTWTLPVDGTAYDLRGTLTGSHGWSFETLPPDGGSPRSCDFEPADGVLDRAPDAGFGSDFDAGGGS